jgi:hypothetical protein
MRWAARLLGIAQELSGDGRFLDNGDGTITDSETGLMWEKKSRDGSLHDAKNAYTWALSYNDPAPDGTLFTTFLSGLNESGFAGHTDWRIPTISELETIIDYTAIIGPTGGISVPGPFNSLCVSSCPVTTCSCTTGDYYW